MRFYVNCAYIGDGHHGKIQFQTEQILIDRILLELKDFVQTKFKDPSSIKIKAFQIEFEEWQIWQDKDGFAYENLLDFIDREIDKKE